VKDTDGEETVNMNAVRLNSGALLDAQPCPSSEWPSQLCPAYAAGHMLPSVGLGVYKSASGGECYQAVLSALKLGYRHIDTAQIYGNEADVGR
jgi:hypothetical protein